MQYLEQLLFGTLSCAIEMPVAYSKDLRTRVIATWEAKQESQRQLAERLK